MAEWLDDLVDVAGFSESMMDAAPLFFGAAVLVVAVAFAVLQPYYEAKTFNKCTHSSATYWDAVWADLRVLECKP